MGDEADAKWHRALLKKLRGAVAVKTRVDAGDAARLQKSQAGKGTKRAIDDALHALKQAGLGRDSPLVRAAFEAGAREGTSAMEKAAKRGPDGGADGLTPSKKRLKREARAEAYAEGGGGGGEADGGKKTSSQSSRSRGERASRDEPTTSGPRNPHVSGHVFAACKRAVYALHALAKEPEETAARNPESSYVSRFVATVASASSPASLVAAADARLAGVALWSLAKTSRRAADASAATVRKVAVSEDADKKSPTFVAATARLGRAVSERFADVARFADARGAATAAWSAASLATATPVCLDRAVAARVAGKALRRLSELADSANPQDAANALWACARLRVAVDAEAAKRLVAALVAAAERNVREKKFPGGPNPREMSAALWALATLHGDGLCPDAGAVAAPLASAAGAAARDRGDFTPRCVGDAAWACGKLLLGASFRNDTETVESEVVRRTHVSAVSSLAAAARVLASDASRAFPPRNLANTLWACAAARVDRALAEPLAAAFFATTTAAGRADAERKRRAAAKERLIPGPNAGDGDADDARFETDEILSLSFEDAKPSPDDVAAAVEAVAILRLKTVDPERIRAAVSSALTVPADGPAGIGWRAAGRLEHATFAALGCGPARSTVAASDPGVSSQNREVLRRLLRRGAAAAAAADAERLALEEGASAAMLRVLAGESRETRHRASADRSILCVDDTHRLLSLPLREGRWKVTQWNRFGRRERVGSAWPATAKTEKKYDAAAVRYPPTRAAAEMALAAAAARTPPGAPVWIYGARVEGVFGAARDFDRSDRDLKPVVSRSLFRDVSVVFASACGAFGVVAATRAEPEDPEDGKDGDGFALDGVARFRSVTKLVLPLSNGAGALSETVENWSVYPGLFAGGGLDVMTAFLLRAMPDRFETPQSRIDRPDAKRRTPFAVLDYCAGSGVLAAAVRRRVPDDAALTLTDADAVALRAARENFAALGRGVTLCASDGFSGLAPGETFDLIVSNPPVHLGLQPEFTVLRALVRECVSRLNPANPSASVWFVAQRYVPVASICADADVDATCARADDRFAAWRVARSQGGGEARSSGKQKKATEEKKAKKAKKEKNEKKEKKEKKTK